MAHGSAAPTESVIALTWLCRLRWLAMAGQVLAMAVARWGFGVVIPMWPIVLVILLTAVSNVMLVYLLAWRKPVTSRLSPAVLVLDVLLLTVLLYWLGGAYNPFATLYVIHVAMGVAVAGWRWTWLLVVLSATSYGLLIVYHVPMRLESGEQLTSGWPIMTGAWLAMVLEAGVIAYFIGRMSKSLRQRNRELAHMREQVEHTRRLTSLSTLAAGAAHELGTPLGTIAVVAREIERLAEQATVPAELAEDARLIRQQVDRCQTILERLRIDDASTVLQKRERISLQQLSQRVLTEFAEVQVQRVQVQIVENAELALPVEAVRQAVSVLLHNALDASADAQTVRWSMQVRAGGQGEQRLLMTVEDQGAGMQAEILRRAGEPFFTTKPIGKGMGLGLFLARVLIERIGGQLRLDSKPGSGTRADVELELSPRQSML